MKTKTPLLDSRTSRDIYSQALKLAQHYCPEWADKDWEPDHFDPDDPGLVMFRLFSNLTEHLVTRLDRVPDKHRLAFLDFMGIDLLPAKPARVPLTFYLAEGASGAYVPPAAAVASSKDPDTVFETVRDLRVLPARLGAVFSLDPRKDTYTDHSNEQVTADRFSVFGKGEKRDIDHVLYLGDDTVFDIRRPVKELKIRITGKNLEEKYFDLWLGGSIPHGEIKVSIDTLEVPFSAVPVMERSRVDNAESFWLSVRPGIRLADTGKLPEISGINVDLTVEGILPGQAFFNDTPIDMKKGFYPFGETPQTGDTLYIGSKEAFSKKNARITLNIVIEKAGGDVPVLAWEYWNGKSWEAISGITDGTAGFTKSGAVSFKCPSVEIVEINGQTNRWIRVRIASGNYGTPASFEKDDRLADKLKLTQEQKDIMKQEGLAFGFKYKDSSIKPPFIKSVNIDYWFNNQPILKIKTYNNFHYADRAGNFRPYEPTGDRRPAMYLGFENAAKIAGTSVSVYFAVKEKLSGTIPEGGTDNGDSLKLSGAVSLKWEYRSGGTWKELRVDDETGSLAAGGMVFLHIPEDAANTAEFGQDLCWIRISPRDEKVLSLPELKGISPNTVWAVNSSTARDEVLGSGNGKPGLSLSFSKRPVLEGQVIEMKEAAIPPDDELKILESGTGGKPLRLVKDEKTGEIKEIWVRWHEVKDFTGSGSLSRHYVLDRAGGKILFGDGVRGMLPPKGKNSIVAREYRSGGGRRGNMGPGTITQLKRKISNIESVTNHISSSGGKDQEDLDKAVTRGPYAIKNRNRAVTREDFERLALEASQDVVKAKCIQGGGGRISVIIVPDEDGDTPLPESGLIDTVGTYLKERSLATIRSGDWIKVTGPEYEKINMNISVTLLPSVESSGVRERIIKVLRSFLHPLKGGQEGDGWDFGDKIFESEVVAVVERIEGIDYITHIDLGKSEQTTAGKATGAGYVALKKNALPCAGTINVNTG